MWNRIVFLACFTFVGAFGLFGGEYRVLEDASRGYTDSTKTLKVALPNGIEALLLSDPGFVDSSAALAVGVGSWDDPLDHPGMAHFVEHLLFLGTESYPEEAEYKRYILERGGRSNASTFRGKTVYGFSIDTSYLMGALDRFAHFFINPLFTNSAIEREVHAVHHEFEDSLENEFSRIWRVFKETGNPKHPNANFSFGNLESLKAVEREDVVSWFKEHYLAGEMKLVLMSPMPLEELADLASDFFSEIPKGEEKKDRRLQDEDIGSPFQQGHFIHMDSAFNSRILSLLWEVPKGYMSLDKMKVLSLIQSALNHGYTNSLGSVLEKEGLAKRVKAEFWRIEKENGIFRIDVLLTPKGVGEYRQVIERCFQALSFLKGVVISEDVFKRLIFQGKSSLLSSNYQVAMRVAADLIDTPIEEYPEGGELSHEEGVSLIPLLVDVLSSSNGTYFLVAPTSETEMEPSRLEKWMGTKYLVRKVPYEEIIEWSRLTPHPRITLWEESALTEDFPAVEVSIPNLLNPVFIIDNERARIRWMDSPFKGDEIEAFFCMATPFLESSLQESSLNELLALSIQKKGAEVFKDIEWKVDVDRGKLCVYLKSPKELLKRHVDQLFSFMRATPLSSLEFDVVKEEYLKSYRGDPEPLIYAQQVLDSVMSSFHYTEMELYQGVLQLTYEEYDAFQQRGFDEAFMEGSFLGPISKEEAISLVEEVYERFPFAAYQPKQKKTGGLIFSDEALTYSQKTHRKGSSLLLLVASNEKEKMRLPEHQIIAGVMQSEFFQELRTRQQTAYKLHNWSERLEGHLCHGFALQSSTHCPEDLLSRVNTFLLEFSENAEKILSEERIGIVRNSLILRCENQKKQKEKEADKKVLEWNIRALKRVTPGEVVRIAKEIFCLKNTRRVAVLIEGGGCASGRCPTLN